MKSTVYACMTLACTDKFKAQAFPVSNTFSEKPLHETITFYI